MLKLGVNIDHVATVREARKTVEPDPADAVPIAESSGADGIVCHLRKDRRHINDDDLKRIKEKVATHLNLEMSVDPEIVSIACGIRPEQATLVPENRKEVTTEGGLDVVSNFNRVADVVERLNEQGIEVNLFIDPDEVQIDAAVRAGAKMVEFHTGSYAEEFMSGGDHLKELEVLEKMTSIALSYGLIPCAGHGLTYQNVVPVARIQGIHELNIGHSIISRAVLTGLSEAVGHMKELIS